MDDPLIPQEHRAAIERLRGIKAKPSPHSMMHVMVRLIDLNHYLAALDYLEDQAALAADLVMLADTE